MRHGATGRGSRCATTASGGSRSAIPWSGGLERLDALLMRKDPPFDMEYIYTTYILELAENRGLFVVNKPASLRDINEKAYTSWFPQCTPPSLVTRSRTALLEFLKEHGKVVLKPFDGMGGRSVFIVTAGDLNTNVIIETLTDNGARFTLAQRYLPEIVSGDKRILLIDGEPIDYALARIPAPGESRGNLVMGARGEGRPLTDRDRWLCAASRADVGGQGRAVRRSRRHRRLLDRDQRHEPDRNP